MADENGKVVETVLLPEDLWQKTKFKSVIDRVSFSEVVQRALAKYLGPRLPMGPTRKRTSKKTDYVQMVLPYGNGHGDVSHM